MSTSAARHRRLVTLMALFLPCGAMGCTVHVMSPPTGPAPLEAPAALERGEHALAGEFFGGLPTDIYNEARLYGGRVSYRAGLGSGVELSLRPTAWRFIDDEGYNPGRHTPRVGTGRAGLKWAPSRHFALFAGFGGGGHAAGTFVAEDVGFSVGFDGATVAPFGTASFFASQPIKVRAVRLEEDIADDTHVVTSRPENSYGITAGGGVRFTLAPRGRIMRVLPSILTGLQFVQLWDDDEDFGYMVFTLAVEVRIRTRRSFPDLKPHRPGRTAAR